MLTKKDSKAVAEIIKSLCDWRTTHNHPDSYYYGVRDVAEKLADYFTTQNPRFDHDQFMKACGLTE